MNTYRGRVVTVIACLVALASLAGCRCIGQQQEPETVTVTEKEVVRETVVRWEDPLMLEKMAPTQVSMGQNFESTIKATNKADQDMSDVVITDEPGNGLTFVSADPEPNSRNPLTWNLGELKAGQSKTITVTSKADSTGTVENCATGTYKMPVCAIVDVVSPKLALEKSGPAEVLTCDTITYTYKVTNPGTGTAKNVKITDNLPDGLQTMDGQTTYTQNVGDLTGGASKTYTLDVKAQQTGTFTNEATAEADGDLSAEDSVQTVVKQPVLSIEKTGRGKIFRDQAVTYTITVENTGDAPARDLKVTDTIDPNMSFHSASNNGTRSGNTVTWNLGTLQPGASEEVTVTLKGAKIVDNTTNKAEATAVCAEAVTDTAETEVAGIPAVLLEVVDDTDPIPVGENVTYSITVTNQGSLPDTNVRIKAILDPTMGFVSAGGPTDGEIDGRTVTWAPLAKLAPKEEAAFKLVVKANEAAPGIRLRVELETDSLEGEPVMETESTNFYE